MPASVPPVQAYRSRIRHNPAMTVTVALLGFGALGSDLVALLGPERESGAIEFAGAVVRHPERHRPLDPPGGYLDAETAIERAEVIVECAGVAAARAHGPSVVAAGRTLVLASVGALADPDAARGILGGPGEAVITSGAIGGLDLVRAAAQAGGIDAATITTSKTAASLVQAWMSADEADRIRALDGPELLFDGTPREAIERFPGNVNVAVALAVACRGLGTIDDGLARVRVRIVADPHTDTSTHRIEASGSSGDYVFEIGNRPSAANPRTSALTAQALAADVRALLARR